MTHKVFCHCLKCNVFLLFSVSFVLTNAFKYKDSRICGWAKEMEKLLGKLKFNTKMVQFSSGLEYQKIRYKVDFIRIFFSKTLFKFSFESNNEHQGIICGDL